ncbi:class I SAM-dependent methyltransferase [Streptomyces sp. CAU 1734]|uniref:class I SAM-dependent methyltransferase n=1 Tax=Streptomyces sp. CAU 1734 TaxID=3140360 RepID=UPI00326053D8
MTKALPGSAVARPYVFAESGDGERERLELLARLLDPMHRRALSLAGMRAGLRCLELGSGTGTVATWMAGQVGAGGSVLATDINLSFLQDLRHPRLAVRELDVLTDGIPPRAFDVITCRALLHHLPAWESVVERLAAGLRPDGALVLIEPDAGAAVFGEPEHQRFWSAWCDWGRTQGIDFRLGRELPGAVRRAGLDPQGVTMEVPFYGGGSPWHELYRSTVTAARPRPAAWTGRDPSAEFERLGGRDGGVMCSFGWLAVCGRSPRDTPAEPSR